MKKKYLQFSLTTAIYMIYMASVFAPFVITTSARADTPTPVPTITITAPPPYVPVIPTQSFPTDLTCPTGAPSGWGVSTPNSTWSLLCSQCAYTPFPTNTMPVVPTWDGTGTPPPTYTITPTAITTLTQTPVPLGEFTFTNEGWTIAGIGNAYNSSSWCSPTMGNDTSLLECYGFFDGRVNAGSAVGYQLTLNAVDIPLHFYWDIQHDNPSNQDMFCTLGGVGTVDCFGDLIVTTGGSFALSLVADNTDGAGTNIPVTGDWTVNVSSAPIIPIGSTGTPTVTPTAGSYCSVVDTSADEGFSWTGITVGQTYCFDIGPYEGFDFWGMSAPPILSYPWILHACVQDIDIGVVTVFAVQVSIATIVYVLAVVAIIRNMFVS